MNSQKGQECDNLSDFFNKENLLIMQVLKDNQKMLHDDLDEEVSPIQQHRWQVLSRKLELYGLKFSWQDLRNKFKFMVKTGTLQIEPSVQSSEAKGLNNVGKEVCLLDNEEQDSDDDSITTFSHRLLDTPSTPDFKNLPCTSTPKNSAKHTANFVCSLTISPMTQISHAKQLVYDQENEEKFVDKVVQTTSTANETPQVFVVDPKTGELRPAELTEVQGCDEYEHQPKKPRMEMSAFEKSLYVHQKKLYRQKMEQRAKEHELKLKLLERQLQTETEASQIQMEIAKLKRALLLREFYDDDSDYSDLS